MAEVKLGRWVRFHRDAVMSGGGKGIALAGFVTVMLGGSVGALTVWLANVSWVIAALVAMASLFAFYAWGAYRVWDATDHRAHEAERGHVDAEAALEAERTQPKGGFVGFNISGDGNHLVSDNSIFFAQSREAKPGLQVANSPSPELARRAHALTQELFAFLAERQRGARALEEWLLRPPGVSDEEWYRRRCEDMRRDHAFSDETVSLYNQRYAVRALAIFDAAAEAGLVDPRIRGRFEHVTSRPVIEHIAQQLGTMGHKAGNNA